MKRGKKLDTNPIGWLYISPVLLGILLFTAVPVGLSIVYSLHNGYDGFRPLSDFKWGVKNYIDAFTVDSYSFWHSMMITFVYAIITVPLTLTLSFFLALMLNAKKPGIKAYRVLIYLPCIIPAISSGILWVRFFDVDWGYANVILESLGLPPGTFFSKAESSMPTLIFKGLFTLGSNMVMWIAAMKNVPDSLYEGARIDGASKARQIFIITVPMCTPMIFFNLVMAVIGSFQVFGDAFILTGGRGGVNESLLFIVFKIYNSVGFKTGYAAALSWILFLVILFFTLLLFKTSRKWVFNMEDF